MTAAPGIGKAVTDRAHHAFARLGRQSIRKVIHKAPKIG